MKKLLNKSYVFLLGFIFSFLVLEFSLTIYAYIYSIVKSQDEIIIKKDQFRILCLGNSHTMGQGVDSQNAYPALLNNKLNKFFNTQKFTVINKGISNSNTSHILDELSDDIKKYKPHLVIIMAGEPNIWNRYGYAKYLLMNDLNKNNMFSYFFNFLSKSRIFKLLSYLFSKEKNFSEYMYYSEDEKALHWMARAESNSIKFNELSPGMAYEIKLTVESYLKKHKSDSTINLRQMYNLLAKLHYEYFSDWEQSIYYFNLSINYSKSFDILSFLFLKENHNNTKIPNSHKTQFKELFELSNSKYPGDKLFKGFLDLANENPRVLTDELLNFSVQIMPGSPFVYKYILRKMESDEIKDENKYLEILFKAIENCPMSGFINEFVSKLHNIKNFTNNPNTTKRIEDFMKKYNESYPNSGYVNEVQLFQVLNWVKFDLSQILTVLKQNNIPLVIQNYHYLRFSDFGEPLNKTISDFAKLHGLVFSDTQTEYLKKMKNSSLAEDDFYVKKYGSKDNHPSEMGHQVISDLLLKDLVESKLVY